jgi:GLPGLI family protein
MIYMKYFIILILITVSTIGHSQKLLTGIMTYQTSYYTASNQGTSWKSTLYFRGNETLIEEVIAGKPTEKIAGVTSIYPKLPQSVLHYKNTCTIQLISRIPAEVEMVIVDDTLKPINWKVHPDTRKVGQFVCHKATGVVKGRTYTAWFAPSIAVSTGPWKFHGLPGLILEAEDDTGEVKFLFESLTIPAPDNIEIKAPVPIDKQKRMSAAEHKKYTAQKFESLRKMLESKPTDDGVQITIEIGKPRGIELDN